MEEVLYRTVGLPYGVWQLVEGAKKNRVFIEVYGPNGSTSQALTWLVRGGAIRMEQKWGSLEVKQ